MTKEEHGNRVDLVFVYNQILYFLIKQLYLIPNIWTIENNINIDVRYSKQPYSNWLFIHEKWGFLKI